MKNALLISCISIMAFFPSCYFPDQVRKVNCAQPEDYTYLDFYHTWKIPVCTTSLCSTYTNIWKELLIERTTLTEPYFNKHFEIVGTEILSGYKGDFIYLEFKIQNDWAIAYSGDRFVIRIDEGNSTFPEIGLPKGSYLTKEEIATALDHRGFDSRITEIPKTGPLKFSTMNEALAALIVEAKVDTLCFNRIILSHHTSTLTLEAFAEYEDEEDTCIDASIDLITGRTHIRDRPCTRIWGQ
ncbi:MAG: hypothetical protein ABFS28_15225 [Bacteroidota bacterium]